MATCAAWNAWDSTGAGAETPAVSGFESIRALVVAAGRGGPARAPWVGREGPAHAGPAALLYSPPGRFDVLVVAGGATVVRQVQAESHASTMAAEIVCPLSLRLGLVAAMLNFELPDHPVYDAAELLWFDDVEHGTGMLAFLRRREDRRTDYYAEPGLRLDTSDFFLGAGTGAWTVTEFTARHLHVADDGVVADAVFTDVDGREIEIHIDDRDGKPRRRCGLLGPVGDDIEQPEALLLVWLPALDLVRRGRSEPVIRIDGEDVAVVRVPGSRLHRRHIIKYSAPLCTAEVGWRPDGPVGPCPPEAITELTPDGWRVTGLAAERDDHRARLHLAPGLPDLRSLPEGRQERGRWWVTFDDARLTGGAWQVHRAGDVVRLGFDVDERWRPGWLPALMRVVVRLVPAFRRWPTTYRWRAEVRLGSQPTLTAAWERVEPSDG